MAIITMIFGMAMMTRDEYLDSLREAYHGYFEKVKNGEIKQWKWEDTDAKKFSRISKTKAYKLSYRFAQDFFDLLILCSPNGHVFSNTVRALYHERVWDSERFVKFYISKFIGGTKEYVHVKGVGEKVEAVLSDLYLEITRDVDVYTNYKLEDF